jgi:hypothetical protein
VTEVRPRDVIESVFNEAGVRRVISIDDNYEPLPPVADILGSLGVLTREAQEQILSPLPGLFSVDPEILEEKIGSFWEQASEEEKRQLAAIVVGDRAADKLEAVDAKALPKLFDLFSSYQFRVMGLAEWRAEAEQIFENSKERRTLVMFDENLQKHGGASDEGLKLIQDTFAKTTEDHLICCLVSHNYHLDTLQEAWKKVCSDRGFPQSRFVIIPKELLIDSPVEFAGLIKLTAVTKPYALLKSRAKEIFGESLENAYTRIDEMTIYDLDQIVFASSDREGVWEPDSLFRLLGIFHRRENRHRALKDADLRKASAEVRRISGIAIPSISKPSGELHEVQHLENYEEADQINHVHRPTDLGDIYEKDGGRRYILIAPQCDLMVRTRAGFRGSDADLLREVVLAEIVTKRPPAAMGWELEFYSESRPFFVDFKKTFTTKLRHLDFCVFNENGNAAFSLKDKPSSLLIPAWEKRYIVVRSEVEQMLRAYDRIKPLPNQKDEISRLLTRSSNESLFSGSIDMDSETVKYNFKRVSRLLPPRAGALIGAYAQFLARDAFEHSFTKATWKEAEKRQFFELTERFRATNDETELQEIKTELGRIVFGN